MLEINLWDNTFAHLQTPDGKYSMVHKKVPKNIKYVCKKTNYDGITIFTDHFLNPVYIKSVKSKFKVGWYIERCEINRTPKMMIENYINELDFLMTNDSDILDKYPNKAKFVPFGGTTEKLVDAFMVGAVPIYWGCPNIGDFFDINGIITFDSVEELKDIADNKLENFYENNTKSIVVNHHVAKQYAVTEDWFYHNIFKECFDV